MSPPFLAAYPSGKVMKISSSKSPLKNVFEMSSCVRNYFLDVETFNNNLIVAILATR